MKIGHLVFFVLHFHVVYKISNFKVLEKLRYFFYIPHLKFNLSIFNFLQNQFNMQFMFHLYLNYLLYSESTKGNLHFKTFDVQISDKLS